MRLALSAAVMVAAAPALAGTVITSEMTMPKMAAEKSVIYLEPDHVRVESMGNVTIFRGDQNTAFMLNPGEKKFVKMTPEAMKQMAAAMDDAKKQMAEQMKSMPPEQRAEAEKMMAAMPGQGAKVEFRKAGGTATFGRWQCERVDQLVNGQPQAQLCVAKLAELGLGDADLGVLQRFATFMQQASPASAGDAAAVDPKALEKIVGYPAFSVHVEIPAAKMQTTTKSVEQKALAANLFEVPAGYTEEKMQGPQ